MDITIVKGGAVIDGTGRAPIAGGAVRVDDGRIAAVGRFADMAVPEGATIIDRGDETILPGLVDSHVHINEPGRTEWEGFETATRAAAAGGYTTLVDMPLNCLPPTATVAALDAKREAAREQCWVDWLAWGGVVSDNPADIEALETMVLLRRLWGLGISAEGAAVWGDQLFRTPAIAHDIRALTEEFERLSAPDLLSRLTTSV